MRIAFFDTHSFDRPPFLRANNNNEHEITFFEPRLNELTAELTKGYDAVCIFVNDVVDASTLMRLKENGVKLIALRSAGYNNVDLKAADEFGLPVVRVPEYSPYAVAEHAVSLILTLNRKIHRAYARVRELNFSLEGLVGFDLHGKTVGIIGTGRIGVAMAKIMHGFGCEILAYDVYPNSEITRNGWARYVDLQELYQKSDIISLHVPLTPKTFHIIDGKSISEMKSGVILVNTGRGALIDSKALVEALKSHRVGGAALDVYEEEEGIFFEDLSEKGLEDDVLARLLTFPNVLITSHQAFLTHEALKNIAETTLENISQFERRQHLSNQVSVEMISQ